MAHEELIERLQELREAYMPEGVGHETLTDAIAALTELQAQLACEKREHRISVERLLAREKTARTEGWLAGREAAAKWHEAREETTPWPEREAIYRDAAESIRNLAPPSPATTDADARVRHELMFVCQSCGNSAREAGLRIQHQPYCEMAPTNIKSATTENAGG